MMRFPLPAAAVALTAALALSGCSALDVATVPLEIVRAARSSATPSAPASATPSPSPTPTPTATPTPTPLKVELPRPGVGESVDPDALRRALVEGSLHLRTATITGTVSAGVGGKNVSLTVDAVVDRRDEARPLMEVSMRVSDQGSFDFIVAGDETYIYEPADDTWYLYTAEDLAREGMSLPRVDYAGDVNKNFALPGEWTYRGEEQQDGVTVQRYRLTTTEASFTGIDSKATRKAKATMEYLVDELGNIRRVQADAPRAGVKADVVYSGLNEYVNIEVPS